MNEWYLIYRVDYFLSLFQGDVFENKFGKSWFNAYYCIQNSFLTLVKKLLQLFFSCEFGLLINLIICFYFDIIEYVLKLPYYIYNTEIYSEQIVCYIFIICFSFVLIIITDLKKL